MIVYSKKRKLSNLVSCNDVEVSHTFFQVTFVKCLLCASFGIGAKEVKEPVRQAGPGRVYILVEEIVQNVEATFRKATALGLEQKRVGRKSPLQGAMEPEASVELRVLFPQLPLQHVTYNISSPSKCPLRALQPATYIQPGYVR